MAERSKFEEIMAQLDEDGGSTPDTPANTESGGDDEFSRIMAQARGEVAGTPEAERQAETAPAQPPVPEVPVQPQVPAQPRVLRPLVDDGTLLPTRGNQPILTRRRLIFGALGAAALTVGGTLAYKYMPKDKFSEDVPEGPPGTQLMDEYTKIAGGEKKAENFLALHQKVLEWVDKGYITKSSREMETIKVTGKSGLIVEFKITKQALRFGNEESFFMFPLDGPHAVAACRMLKRELPTRWMAHEFRRHVFKNGGKIWLIAEPEILESLGEHTQANERSWELSPNFGRRKGPAEMRTPRMIRARGELFMALVKGVDPSKAISGHFKEVIQDPEKAAQGKLATLPACSGKEPVEDWEKKPHFGCSLVAERHPVHYHDYSHGVRCAEPEVRVYKIEKDGDEEKEVDVKTMTIQEFYANADYRKEFGLPSKLDEIPYRYPATFKSWQKGLQKWLKEHGYEDIPAG